MEFIGRERELASLRAELDRPKPSLIIAYGRRRVGKSRLLREATEGHPGVYFQATRVSPALNFDAFKGEIAKALGPSALLDSITDWHVVFQYLADNAERSNNRLVVTIDEFPYITDGDQALPSILQKFWDFRCPSAGQPENHPLRLINLTNGRPACGAQPALRPQDHDAFRKADAAARCCAVLSGL